MTSYKILLMGIVSMMMTFVPKTSAMLFQTQSPQMASSCVEGIPQLFLESVTSGLANSTYLYDVLLRNIARVRVPGTRGSYEVREFIAREMSNLGWTVDQDPFTDNTPFGQVAFKNIMATFNPAKAKRIVIACHYDSKLMQGRNFIGAMDAAAGCAIMIDTARKMQALIQAAQDHELNNFSLQLIFFDGEEAFVTWTRQDSLYGSRHLAQMWENSPDPNDALAVNYLQNIDLFILFDLIGAYRTRFVNYYANTTDHFNRMTDIEICLKNSNLMTSRPRPRIFDPNGRAWPVEDDHLPFVHRGVKVLHLISTPFPGTWHTLYDDLAHLDRALIEDFSRIFRVYLTTLLMGL